MSICAPKEEEKVENLHSPRKPNIVVSEVNKSWTEEAIIKIIDRDLKKIEEQEPIIARRGSDRHG